MGFMDKAKKMAEQAQQKIDEVQKDFNAKQGTGGGTSAGGEPGGAGIQYDQQGRPMATDTERPQGDQVAAPTHAPEPPAATPQPQDGPGRSGDPLLDAEPPKQSPPPSGGQGMSSGDPLAG